MAYILNIETATRNCSVSLAKDGITIALQEYAGEGYAHAEKLHVFIENVLVKAGIAINDLNAVAVSMGPGSYTGLRIGVSAAKGLCYALNIPLIAVDTLELLARQVRVSDGVIVPMVDARRMEVYMSVFNIDFTKAKPTTAEVITDTFFMGLSGPFHLIGDGAAKCRQLLKGSQFVYHDDILFPSAKEMSEVSYNNYKISDTVDVAYFEPYYLKDFIAGK
jgi:tRNA threonylcarbamoyladenosine biosynthesis protein TsaB